MTILAGIGLTSIYRRFAFLVAVSFAVALFLLALFPNALHFVSYVEADDDDSVPDHLILDTFDDIDGPISLSGHAPTIAPDGIAWFTPRGEWQIVDERATETSGPAFDSRAIIDAGAPNVVVSARITWRSGFAGVLVRYVNEQNWIMAWFDGVGSIVLGKMVNDEFTEIDRARFDWGAPGRSKILELSARGELITVRIGERKLIERLVPELTENTIVGLFSRFSTENTFDDFTVTEASLPGVPKSEPEPDGPLVVDRFDDRQGTSLSFHSPDVAPSGSSWMESSGRWEIESQALRGHESSVAEQTGAIQDHRAVINAGQSNVAVRAEIRWRDRRTGLVVRYADESNWIMAWFDGLFNTVVIGKNVDGEFKEVGRVPFSWGNAGKERRFEVTAFGDEVSVSIDGTTLLTRSIGELSDNTFVGLFSRATTDSTFDDFVVERVSVHPISNPIPGGPVVQDSFKDRSRTPLGHHPADIAPNGNTWAIAEGGWIIAGNKVRELTGEDFRDHRAVIDSGASDVIVEADIIGEAGRVGLVVRYADESNWIMAWFDGVLNDLIIGKKVDGEFKEVGRVPFAWGDDDDARRFQVSTVGDEISVSIDGTTLLTRSISELLDNTFVGLFSRATPESTFDNFEVNLAPSFANNRIDLGEFFSANILETSFDPSPTAQAQGGVFVIRAEFTNASADDFDGVFFEVTTLEGPGCPCVMLNADGGPGGVGSILTVGDIAAGVTFESTFEVGLTEPARFDFFVDVFSPLNS